MKFPKKPIHPALLPADTPETAARLLIQAKGGAFVATLNLEILSRAAKDPHFQRLLRQADYRICDGIGAKWLLQCGYPHTRVPRIAGIDLGSAVLSAAAEEGRSVFLLGGRPGVAHKAACRLKAVYHQLHLAGCAHGYFSPSHLPLLRDRIIASKASILIVCLGSPRQENWILQNRAHLPSVRLFLPLGGSLDVWAGDLSRAPILWQKMGTEWLWRILQEPCRILRLAGSCTVFWDLPRKNSPKCMNLFQIE